MPSSSTEKASRCPRRRWLFQFLVLPFTDVRQNWQGRASAPAIRRRRNFRLFEFLVRPFTDVDKGLDFYMRTGRRAPNALYVKPQREIWIRTFDERD